MRNLGLFITLSLGIAIAGTGLSYLWCWAIDQYDQSTTHHSYETLTVAPVPESHCTDATLVHALERIHTLEVANEDLRDRLSVERSRYGRTCKDLGLSMRQCWDRLSPKDREAFCSVFGLSPTCTLQ